MSEDVTGAASQRRPRKGRSPSYPGISLEEAEKRVRELYNVERQHNAPVSAIVEHWGYGPTSSGGRTIVAALKKFGLLEDDGSGDERTGRLTDLAVDLVLNPDPVAARQEAALLPRFHRQMWDEYGSSLPSAATLRYRLIREFGFTESGAEEFVQEYQATIEYAGLPESGAEPDGAEAAAADASSLRRPGGERQDERPAVRPVSGAPAPSPLHSSGASNMTIPIPLLGGSPVYISGEFPLTEGNWSQMMRVLEAMKPGLVEPDVGPKENLPPPASPERNAPGEADGGLRSSDYDDHDG